MTRRSVCSSRVLLLVVFFIFLAGGSTFVSGVDSTGKKGGEIKEKETSWKNEDRDEYELPICHDETLRRSPVRSATSGEIAAKMSQATRYVDGHVRVSRDRNEMHVDAKVIRVNGNLSVGRNLYF